MDSSPEGTWSPGLVAGTSHLVRRPKGFGQEGFHIIQHSANLVKLVPGVRGLLSQRKSSNTYGMCLTMLLEL